jgi:hypothetical protein
LAERGYSQGENLLLSIEREEGEADPVLPLQWIGPHETELFDFRLRVTPATQTPTVPLMSNPPGLGGGGYTRGRGFSRGRSQRGRGYYPWRGRRRSNRSDSRLKVNVIRLIGDWGVKERCPLNKMANSALAMFPIRMGNIEV